LAAIADAQPPIRIGASLSYSGAFKALSQNQVGRGYALCVKHTNEKGGVLGRKLELVLEDDRSEPATAAGIYEKLITQDKVDLVLGPYGSPMTATVAEVVEKHRMPMVAAGTATTSLFKQGRKFIFMVHPPGEVYFEGLIDMAARRGLRTVAVFFGPFKVDPDGLQIAHKMLTFQWQDGKKVLVWPEELAPGRARFPMPPWTQRP
jgi:branched-chain amino acid transport system substrate-binding protein